MAKQHRVIPVANGTVLFVKDMCLPPLVVVEFFPDGEWDEDVPAYMTYALQLLSDFTEADKEAGLPGYHFVRDTEWLHRDPVLEAEGDFVLTNCAVHMEVHDPIDFSNRTRVVGRLSEEALVRMGRKCVTLVMGPDPRLSDEELRPRSMFAEAIHLALTNG